MALPKSILTKMTMTTLTMVLTFLLCLFLNKVDSF